MRVGAVVVAAGSASRMQGIEKQSLLIGGIPVVVRSLLPFQQMNEVTEIAVVAREDMCSQIQQYLEEYKLSKAHLVIGGETRQQSVRNGVSSLSQKIDYIAIHDGARPFVEAGLIRRCLEKAVCYGAAAAAVKTKDTIKVVSEKGEILSTPNRDTLYLAQTPQIFQAERYRNALKKAEEAGRDFTDDCQLVEFAGGTVSIAEGDYRNMKVTTPEDLIFAEAIGKEAGGKGSRVPAEGGTQMRVGHGYDVHRLVEGRRLILGGVPVEYEKGLLGHSDADVLTHAVMDALLGAAALGDIGQHFPDTDPAYEGADSIGLLRRTAGLLKERGYRIGNLDCTVIAQAPKLKDSIPMMRKQLAEAIGIEMDTVSVKATTEEKLGFTGSGEGISAHCVCLIE